MTTNLVTIICSECGVGHYVPAYTLHTPTDAEYVCTECGHEINAQDVTLDEGETLTLDAQGRLAYTTRTFEVTNTCDWDGTCEALNGAHKFCDEHEAAYLDTFGHHSDE